MPNPSKGAYLYLRRRKDRKPAWIIRDGQKETPTGCGPGQRKDAEIKLDEYRAARFIANTGQRDPRRIPIPEVMAMYARDFAIHHAHPELVGYHMGPLLDYWGAKSLGDVKGATCREYVAWRTAQIGRHKRPVSVSTARRELETLQAAINRWHKESPLPAVPAVTLPPKAERRARFLERSEAAALLRAARRLGHHHIIRFILIGIYTGTRHDAILKLRWQPSTSGGHIDLERGLLYRRGSGERETSKRRPTIPIPRRLRHFLQRWNRADAHRGISFVVSWQGEAIRKERRAWASTVRAASLGRDVTPHVLRHTCATWRLWGGETIWDVAGLLGTSADMIDRVYGHHKRLEPGANLGRRERA